MTTTSPHLPGPVPAWYSTLHDIAYDDGAPEDVREAAVEAITAYGALRQDRRELYTEMAKRDIERRAERAAILALADGWLLDLSQEEDDDHGKLVAAVTKDHVFEVRHALGVEA